MTDPVTAFIEAITGGLPVQPDLFASDAVLDATVPNWRFTVEGAEQIRDQLAEWFADPGEFESVTRTPLPDGELLEFTLTWREHGVPHACHQIHVLQIEGEQIAAATAFCGGRWPASLLAEMEAARAHAH